MPGPFAIQNADGTRTLDFINEAPAADVGQVALPVRVISQLGAGTGGGATGGLTDAQLRASPVPVAIASGGSSGGLTDAELRASPVPVSGFPATQPVSGTVNVGNFPTTQPVSGSVGVNNFPASQPVTGTFWQATQPVSGPLTDTQLRASAVPVSGTFWPATQPISLQAADKAVSTTGVTAAAVTATLPAVAGQFHYITRINIIAYATAARTGAATPVVVTSTNLPGSLAWTTPTAAAVGTQYETDIQLSGPLKSSAANTITTIVAPATASVIWRINVVYYTGP